MEYIKTGIKGLDKLLKKGIPLNSSILITGVVGSGKTILTLQILCNLVKEGKKCMYISLEKSEKRILRELEAMNFKPCTNKHCLIIKKENPYDFAKNIELLVKKSKKEIDELKLNFLPDDLDIVVIDSLNILKEIFEENNVNKHLALKEMIDCFEKKNITAFLITRSNEENKSNLKENPEEEIVDGIIRLYEFKNREIIHCLRIEKIIGTDFDSKLVKIKIKDNGIEVTDEEIKK